MANINAAIAAYDLFNRIPKDTTTSNNKKSSISRPSSPSTELEVLPSTGSSPQPQPPPSPLSESFHFSKKLRVFLAPGIGTFLIMQLHSISTIIKVVTFILFITHITLNSGFVKNMNTI